MLIFFLLYKQCSNHYFLLLSCCFTRIKIFLRWVIVVVYFSSNKKVNSNNNISKKLNNYKLRPSPSNNVTLHSRLATNPFHLLDDDDDDDDEQGSNDPHPTMAADSGCTIHLADEITPLTDDSKIKRRKKRNNSTCHSRVMSLLCICFGEVNSNPTVSTRSSNY